jgi:Subtilase family
MPRPEVAAAQRRLIMNDFPEGSVASGPGSGLDDKEDRLPIRYLFRVGHVVVREEYLERVMTILAPREGEPGAESQPQPPSPGESERRPEARRRVADEDVRVIIPGVRLLRLRGWDTFDAIDRVHGVLGPGVVAPDHLVSIAPDAGDCPATEPEPVPENSSPDPRFRREHGTGEGVKVVVIDSGFDHDAARRHWWLHGVTGEKDPAITDGDGPCHHVLKPYAGHGTFIAGVVRSVAPLAEVRVRTKFDVAGANFESELVEAMEKVLLEEFPDVISLSAGTYSWNATQPLCFQVFQESVLPRYKGVVVVAAAGNDACRDYFWPAAAPWAVSAGALDAHWRNRAHFSNFGGWVDVYAPGEDLVNAYPCGRYTYNEPPKEDQTADFHGMARWSGTSFSTPVVAGLIAARMSRTGENGQTAAAGLLAEARAAAIPGLGAVLLP